MEFHTLQSTPYGELICVTVVGIGDVNCVTVVGTERFSCGGQGPMEFHTRQSTPYGGAELRDSCRDGAPGVYAKH